MTPKEYLAWYVEATKSLPMIHSISPEYSSPSEYYLKNGSEFESQSLTSDEKEYLKLLPIAECLKKMCYQNAQRLLLFFPPRGDKKKMQLQYIEGYATNGILPVQHAWLSLNGKVVDPTFGPLDSLFRRKHRILGEFPPNFKYFGVVVSESHIREFIFNHQIWSSIVDDFMCNYPLLTKKSCQKRSEQRK